MKRIILDGKEVEVLVPESLPLLIHGKQGSGASMYTICLAAKWFSQGYSVLFLCGYPMAEEAFANEVEKEYTEVTFFTQDRIDSFKEAVLEASDDTIIIVKNIELFDEELFMAIKDVSHLIISGDVEETEFQEELLFKEFITEIYFSPLVGKEVTRLEKYAGCVISGEYKGITSLE